MKVKSSPGSKGQGKVKHGGEGEVDCASSPRLGGAGATPGASLVRTQGEDGNSTALPPGTQRERCQRTETKAEFVREALNQEPLIFQTRKATVRRRGRYSKGRGEGEHP